MKHQNNSVKQLVERALNKDQEAFSKLYYQTYDRNYYLVLKLVKSEQDTEDILQDTYIKILEKLSQYEYKGESSFASWTSAIASNTALDFLRKKRPTLFSELSEDEDFVFDTADESVEFQPEQQYDQKETAEIVSMILSELSEEQRICILLFYLQNLSIKEIAQQCGCSENTVKSRLNYGRKNIRAQAETLKKFGIHVGESAMLVALVYFLQGEMAYAKTITIVKATSEAAKVTALVSQGGGAVAVATGTKAGVAVAGKTAAAIGAKKMVAVGVAGFIAVGGAGGYAVHKLQPFSSPVNVTMTVMPVETEGVITTPDVSFIPEITEKPVSTEEATKEPATEEPVMEETRAPETKEPVVEETKEPVEKETKAPATKKPTVTAKPTKKPEAKATPKPTKKPTPKPTEDSMEWDDVTVEDDEDDSMEWDDVTVEEE